MLPIHKNAPSNWVVKENVYLPTEAWGINYTSEDMNFDYNSKGNWSWCQEFGEKLIYHIMRGGVDPSFSGSSIPDDNRVNFGWRPVLELIN